MTINKNVKIGLRYNKDISQLDIDDIKGKKTTINNVIAIESSFNLLTVGEYLDIKKEYEKRNIEFALDYYVKNAKIFFNVMNTDS